MRRTLLAAALLLPLFACSGDPTGTPPPIDKPKTTTVQVTAIESTIAVDSATQLTAAAYDQNGNLLTGRTVTWSSSNASVATVNTAGTVTGKATGTARIDAQVDDKRGSLEITVRLPRLALTTVTNLVPGQTATLKGRSFSQLTKLTIDGHEVALGGTSDSLRTFLVPSLRACETDGRPVALVANDSINTTAPVHVATLQMTVGESRVLSGASLSCLALPAADQDYMVTAVNLSRDAVQRMDPLARFRSWTGTVDTATVAPLSNISRSLSRSRSLSPNHVAHSLAAAAAPYNDSPIPFDANYATAQIGDRVRFVDWSKSTCSTPTASAASYEAQIVAIASNVVIAVDTRLSNAAGHIADAALYQEAATIAAPLVLPTMREIFDPNFQPLAGGGSRYYAIVSSTTEGGISTDGGTGSSQASCQLASEMTTVELNGNVPSSWPDTADRIRTLASALVHEYAHNADAITAQRMSRAAGAYSSGARGWIVESLAVTAEETAMRIAMKQSVGAQPSTATDNQPRNASGIGILWGGSPSATPWLQSGWYGYGAGLITFVRDRAGEAALGPSTKTLVYQQIIPQYYGSVSQGWTVDALASTIGLTGDQLLDQWSLAHASEGLIPTEVAVAAGLPQILSWDYTVEATTRFRSPYSDPFLVTTRSINRSFDLKAAPGNYAAAYFMAEDAKAVSLSFSTVAPSGTILRLTRLR